MAKKDITTLRGTLEFLEERITESRSKFKDVTCAMASLEMGLSGHGPDVPEKDGS